MRLETFSGCRDLLPPAEPDAGGRRGEKVRGRRDLDQPQGQEDHAQQHRTLHHRVLRRGQEGLVLLQVIRTKRERERDSRHRCIGASKFDKNC